MTARINMIHLSNTNFSVLTGIWPTYKVPALQMNHFFFSSKNQVFIGVMLLMMTTSFVNASTFYKYLDEKGTMVITQTLDEVPLEKRPSAETIHLPDGPMPNNTRAALETLQRAKPSDLNRNISQETIKAAGQETLKKGHALLNTFFEDQGTVLIAYFAGGLICFVLFSKILKRFVGSFVTQIVMKLAIVVVLFSGVYLLYLSWLNKTVLNFDQAAPAVSREKWTEQLTTPQEILEKTEGVVEQFNQKVKEREALLSEIKESTFAK